MRWNHAAITHSLTSYATARLVLAAPQGPPSLLVQANLLAKLLVNRASAPHPLRATPLMIVSEK